MSQTSPADLTAALETHRPAMIAFARRYVPEPDAEDIVQTAAVQLWTHGSAFRGQSSWLTWALSVVRYAALSHLRTDARRRQVEADAASLRGDTAFPEDPLLALSDADRAWIEAYGAGTAPGSEWTVRRRLKKIRLTLEDSM